MRTSPGPEVDDAGVVRQVRKGDQNAFATLVRAYQSRVFGLVLMVVRSPTGAEDVTQDAFVRAFKNLHRYDDTRPFYPWLAAIAVRLAHNWLRQHGRTLRREGTPIDNAPAPTEPAAALSALIAHERSHRVWAMVASLPARERVAVILHYRDGLPVRDIAATLGVTDGTIKTMLFRARRQMRERWSPESREPETRP
jgi:RNA polymerase sigma-70 factor (ECF subfamily)